jgi:hypothetical protein
MRILRYNFRILNHRRSSFKGTQSPGARSYFQNLQPLAARFTTADAACDGDL